MQPLSTVHIRDFEKIGGISELSVLEDGRRAVFCVQHADVSKNRYEERLYLLDVDEGRCRALTQSGGSGYALCGDDSLIFPALRRPQDKKAVENGELLTVYYRLPLSGGEAREAFRVEAQVKKIESLGGGRWLVSHLCDLTRPDVSGLSGEARTRALLQWKKEQSEFHVFDELPFWFDGRGLVNKKRTSLSVFTEETGTLVPLTAPGMDVGAYVLSPDKQSVTFAGNDVKDWRINEKGLYRVSVCGGQTETIVPCRGHEVSDVLLLGGRTVCKGYVHGEGMDLRSAKLYEACCGTHSLTLALDPDEELGVDISCEANMGGCSFGVVGDEIFLITSREYRARLCAWKPGQDALRVVSPENLNILSFAAAGQRVLAVGFAAGGGFQEVYELCANGARQLTHFHDGLFAGVPQPEPLSVQSDGVRIDGWVLKPHGFVPGGSYPAILSVHGGPRWAYCDAFSHEMQVLSSRGCFVFFCNPRGSSTRGDAFADLADKWGTVDYRDVMAFTDEVLRAYPEIDKNRLGITGGSYGGFMTNWVIGHTDRFAAAATCRSITYWTGFFGVSDLGGWYDLHEQGGLPWKNEEALRRHSPLFDLQNAKTPTLIIHSFEDYRCPVPEAYSLYQALMENGVPTRMVLFKGESHGLSRSGQPVHRVRRLEEIAGWFDRWLGKEEQQ